MPAPTAPSGSLRVALEITPPRRDRPAVLRRRAALLGSRPDAIHVIQRPDRLPSLDASLQLQREGRRAVWHCANRGRSQDAVRRDVERALEGGVRAVLCIRGESDDRDRSDTPKIREVVALLREADPELRIGVTWNQYAPRERALRNLGAKLEAGAHFVQTQPVMAPDDVESLAATFRREWPEVPLLPMLMPLASRAEAERMGARLGIPVPDATLAALARGGAQSGWALFETTLRALRATEGVEGVALMTQRADPDRETVERIATALDAA